MILEIKTEDGKFVGVYGADVLNVDSAKKAVFTIDKSPVLYVEASKDGYIVQIPGMAYVVRVRGE